MVSSKRLVQTGVATMVSVSLLAGCSSGGNTGGSTGGTGEKEASATTKAKGAPAKVTFYANSGALNDMPQGSDAARLDEVKKQILEKTGVDVNAIVPPANSETAKEKLNLLLSSNDEVDVFQASWTDYASKGAIIPLNDLLDKYGQDIKKAWPKESWEMMTDKDGKIWGIPRLTLTAAYPIYLRKEWMQKLGLQTPKTIDDLEVILKTFKEKDPDGNGKDDTIAMSTNLEGLTMSLAAGFLDGGYGDWLDPADKKVKPVEFAPGYKEFVAKMADWYQKGYIYKEAFAKHDPLELLKTNRVGTAARWYSHTTLQLPKVQTSIPEMDYIAVPSLTGPKGKTQTINPGGTGGTVISKKAKNPEAAIKYMNWIYQDTENYIFTRYGIKDKDWKWITPKTIYELSKDRQYAGEFAWGMALSNENKADVNDGTNKMHKEFLRGELLNLDSGKMAFDYNIVYDTKELTDKVPSMNDIKRLRDEEVTKFIMGARPMSDWDKFLDQLNKAGMTTLIDAKTEQYNKLKK